MSFKCQRYLSTDHGHSPYARAIIRNADHREITSAVAKLSHHISIFLRERYDAYERTYSCALRRVCKIDVVAPIFFIGSYLIYTFDAITTVMRIDEAFSAAKINKLFSLLPYKIRLTFAHCTRYRCR